MKVALTVASTPHWESIAEHIEGYKTTHLENKPQESDTLVLTDACSVDQLAEAINNTAISTMVVFYQQAEHYLAEAVNQGSSFTQAAEQWQRTTNHLLQVQRKNRARLKLFNIEQAMAAPQAFSEQLASLQVITAQEFAGSVQHDVALLAACQYVAQSSELLQLNNLLQASSLLLQPDNKTLVDVESIVSGVAAVTVDLQQMKEELDKSVINLTRLEQRTKAEQLKLQQEFEYVHAAHELEKVEKNRLLFDLVTRTSERDALHKKQEELTSQLNESEEENSLLLVQLHQIQEELESSFLEKKPFEAVVNTEQKKQQQTLEKLTSVNQKEQEGLTAQLNESEEENSLLLTQLHQVQEELERIFLDKKRALVQQKQYQREITKLEHKLRNTTADLASKNYRLDLVVQDVDEMKRSVFWKTGAPVRAVSKVLNKSKKRRQKIQNEVELILSSEFFDTEWYLAQYPDVAESTISPAEHYLRFGAQEQRFPGPLFSGAWYTDTYPDVAESGINPLLHYIKFGKAEGRTASVKLLQDLSKRDDV